VRVTLTHNKQTPRHVCFGSPFLVWTVPDERFADTKEQFITRASVEREKVSFGYTNNCQNSKDYKVFKDEDEIAALLHGASTMLYIFLPSAQGQAIGFGASL
jgi:hypothetical protein